MANKKVDKSRELKEEKGMKKAKAAVDSMISAHKSEMKAMGLKTSLKKGGKVSVKKGK